MIYFIFIIISLGYCGFILWLNDGIRYSEKFDSSNINLPEVTIIISARNEENNIKPLLNSLISQDYPNELIQFIIVNDRSNDNTRNILDDFDKKITNLNVINIDSTPKNWAPKKWALNSAITKVSTEIILQTDADCIPNKNWITSMVQPFKNPEIGFVSGPAPLTNNKTFLDSLYELDSLAQDAFSAGGFGHGLVFSCTGRNMGFLKEAFNDVNGYDGVSHFISGDDDLLLHKITSHPSYKVKFVLSKESVVNSPPPRSLDQFIYQRLRFASKGLSYYNIKTSKSLKLALPLVYISNLIILLSIISFIKTNHSIWLLPWLIKSFSDGIITYNFYDGIKKNWNIGVVILLSIIHPLYIVVFGCLGPFSTIKWKTSE